MGYSFDWALGMGLDSDGSEHKGMSWFDLIDSVGCIVADKCFEITDLGLPGGPDKVLPKSWRPYLIDWQRNLKMFGQYLEGFCAVGGGILSLEVAIHPS